MAKINNSNYHHTLAETLHVLGAIQKVLLQDRVGNRVEIGNLSAAMRSIQAALSAHDRKLQRAKRDRAREKLEQERQEKQVQELGQGGDEEDAETEV